MIGVAKVPWVLNLVLWKELTTICFFLCFVRVFFFVRAFVVAGALCPPPPPSRPSFVPPSSLLRLSSSLFSFIRLHPHPFHQSHAEAIKKALKSRSSAAPASPRVTPRPRTADKELKKALAQVAHARGAPSEEALATMRQAYDKMSTNNDTLRAQLADEQARAHEEHGEAQRLRGVEQELRTQIQHLQTRATRAEAEALSKGRTVSQLEDQIKNMGSRGRHHQHGASPAGGGFMTPAKRRSSGSSSVGGFRVPMSPAGKRVHKSSVASMALPGEAWVDEVNNINGQLIECLEELARKDDEVRAW